MNASASYTIDYGIDLGTSNSVIAHQEGLRSVLLAGTKGTPLLPSAVHVGADGKVTVGEDAIEKLVADPANTAIEFKRLMGTKQVFTFPASGQQMTPEELSAEVLKSLVARASQGNGDPVRAAVITVPAMFQLPQCEAVRKAAELTDIEHALLLQEPIAAAMGYAGEGHMKDGYWLIYDLGGGTFDTSLVRCKSGRLQVLGHDGDNHLGGKDFDRLIAHRAAQAVRREGKLGDFARSDPAFAVAFARLKFEAERVRISLSSIETAEFCCDELAQNAKGEKVGIQFALNREELETLLSPLIDRTTALCRKVVDSHGLNFSEMEGLVLVGGPTQTPCLLKRIQEELGLEARHVMDPNTIVAAGAALFASTQKLPVSLQRRSRPGRQAPILLQLEYEPLTTNPKPLLAGRIHAHENTRCLTVRVTQPETQFDSGPVAVNDKHAFALSLSLSAQKLNVFGIQLMRAGQMVACEPEQIRILHGLSVAKPPLSQSVGVMMADNSVSWYLRKGEILPTRKTCTHATTISLSRGQSGDAIHVPLIQGESDRADRNKVIGLLKIHAQEITRDLPAGSEVEVTLSVDEFSRAKATAYLPLLEQRFEDVVLFDLETKAGSEVQMGLKTQQDRLKALGEMADALGGSNEGDDLDNRVQEIETLIQEGDRDSIDLADSMVRKMTAVIDQAEDGDKGSRLAADFEKRHAGNVSRHHALMGESDQQVYQALKAEFQDALDRGEIVLAQEKLKAADDLAMRAMMQTPEFWIATMEALLGTIKTAGRLALVTVLVDRGLRAARQKDISELVQICMGLIDHLPKAERAQVSQQFPGLVSHLS